jgi:hypothetical protein
MQGALLTKLKNLLISEVSAVDDPANQAPGWLVMKARGGDPFLGSTDPDLVIMHRALGSAIRKALDGCGEELNEAEELSVAIMVGALELDEPYAKARHGVRHPQTGKFIPVASRPTYTPGPDRDQYGGAQTEGIPSGTGSLASTPPNPAFPLWNHLGASLIG